MTSRIRVPHTLTLLLAMMVAALLATWIIPQGFFETTVGASGRASVVPGTYAEVAEPVQLGPWHLLKAIPRAFAAAQDIIFFLFIIGGVLGVVRATGTIDALIGRMLDAFGGKPAALIFVAMFVFALASSTVGSSGEYVPFVLVMVALCRAMRMDALTAVAIILSGYGIGYGIGAFIPYTVVVAQQIAELPVYSGWPLRLALLLPFVAVAAHHTWSYARRVREDAGNSYLPATDAPDTDAPAHSYPTLNARHLLIALLFLVALGGAIYGISQHRWYLTELGAAFLAWGLLAVLIGGLRADEAAQRFIDGAKDLTTTAILVGVARGIALILEDGQILHTLVHAMSIPLQHLGAHGAAVGMLAMQTVMNFFIPSGSGQAFVTMPLMAPLGDIVGVSRQVSVLAFQMGDGLANIIVPTNAILMGILGMANVPYAVWLRFCVPLMAKLLALSAVVLVLAVAFGLQ
jgi:uncharacterized ion transporter superfamily protein YfcC